jgi:hypothetical protein
MNTIFREATRPAERMIRLQGVRDGLEQDRLAVTGWSRTSLEVQDRGPLWRNDVGRLMREVRAVPHESSGITEANA